MNRTSSKKRVRGKRVALGVYIIVLAVVLLRAEWSGAWCLVDIRVLSGRKLRVGDDGLKEALRRAGRRGGTRFTHSGRVSRVYTVV